MTQLTWDSDVSWTYAPTMDRTAVPGLVPGHIRGSWPALQGAFSFAGPAALVADD
jgi:hypothetical protein